MSTIEWDRTARALRGDVRLDGEEVDVVAGGGLVSFDEELSISGAPIVRVGVLDPERLLIDTRLLDLHSEDDERLGREVELVLDGVAYWLRSVVKRGDVFELTFEDRTACLLRDSFGAAKTTAGALRERAFIARLCERAGVPAPEMQEPLSEERRARARSGAGSTSFRADRGRDDRVARRARGIAGDARLTVKGVPITRSQIAEANTLLSVGAELNAPEVAMVAIAFAGIAESSLGAHAGTFSSDDGYYGVLQSSPRNWPDPHDTAGMARAFMLGGRGFQGNGAIALARTVSDPVQIAVTVEAPSIWPDNAYARQSGWERYLPEARALAAEFAGGDGTSMPPGTVTRTIEPPLTVERGESYWDAAMRIAESYRFRFFVVANTPYFLADQALMQSERLMTIGEQTLGVTLLDWEWAPRKPLRSVDLECNVRAWQAPPGSVVVLDESCGPAGSDEDDRHRGRWLVGDYQRSRFGDTARITLVKGRKPIVPTQTESTQVGGDGGGDVPVGRGGTTSPFGGNRTYPVSDPYGKQRPTRVHKGCDIAMPRDTPCIAPFDGKITYIGPFSGGQIIHLQALAAVPGTSIRAGDKIGWGHVFTVNVAVGQRVAAGTKVGGSGEAGTGPHCHFVLVRAGGEGNGIDGNDDPAPALRTWGAIA